MDYYTLSQLIQRFRAGTATEEEQYLLENIWNRALADTTFLDGLPAEDREILKQRMFAATQQQIARLEQPVRRRSRWPAMHLVAAAFALLVATATLLIYWSTHRFTTVETRPGERICITLPDSSHVTLNGNSTLRYAANWNRNGTREVWIDGEGFFSVQHTKSHQKFIVHTSQALNVEVLGTKFNVRSRAQRSEVMLAEGKVKLDMTNSVAAPVYLRPGELATVAGKTLSKRVVEQKQYTSWVNNKLVFQRTTLREVATLLHDTYGLDVTFADSVLAQRELSGEIASASADDVLFAIAETFDLRVTRNDTQVTIAIK